MSPGAQQLIPHIEGSQPCNKCGVRKPYSDFYFRKSRGRGCENIRIPYMTCKVCKREDPVKHNERNKQYAKTNTQTINRLHRAYAERYPEKVKARKDVYRAVKSGLLVKQPCEVCGCLSVEAHHENYSKPLSVRWLCTKHHSRKLST